jgi:hypothetical protein
MSDRSLILRAIPSFTSRSSLDSAGLRLALSIDADLTHAEAGAVLELVPLAFGRVLLDGMGIVFSDEYVRIDENGTERLRRKLGDEPLFREALELAPEVMATSGQDVFTAVAIRSSELQAVNNALNAGADPSGLMMSAPVMVWVEERAEKKRPWWKVW